MTSATAEPHEVQQAKAAVHDLAQAPRAEKKEIAVDHKLVMNECQLLLAEKRTAYALLRTGMTVALVPLSIWTVLVATSSLWSVWDSAWMLAPLMGVAVLIFALGAYLVSHALAHVAHVDRVLQGLRQSDTLLEDLLIEHGRASRILNPWHWRRA